MQQQAILQREPLLFTALKALCRSPFRGGDRLFAVAERLQLLSGVIRYALDDRHVIYVPTIRRHDRRDLLSYEDRLVSVVVDKARALRGDITLIDCGADIGLFSVLLLSKVKRINRIVAFEPSNETYGVLQKTLSEQPCECVALQMAVSDHSGLGELKSPGYDPNDTGRYCSPVEAGGFPIVTIDDVLTDRPKNCILKIDIEGGELAAIMGARACIESADGVIVAVEAHPKVAARTGIDPVQVLRLLQTYRPFAFTVAELPEQELDLERPFFEQVQPEAIYNVVCSSR